MKKKLSIQVVVIIFLFFVGNTYFESNQIWSQPSSKLSYPIVDTGVETFYDNNQQINKPEKGEPFYGQDAHFKGNQPLYQDNNDGTITDKVSGLMWQKVLFDKKYSYYDAKNIADTANNAGYNDWRLPTIKELYSLIMFYGEDIIGFHQESTSQLHPFLNNEYFDFRYGNINKNERTIDAQYASSTIYLGKTMNGNSTVFGVNFADGRIKGYPISSPHGKKLFEVRLVRGNSQYGINNFTNNGNGTITDKATGLMWCAYDSKQGMNWEDALTWVQQKNKENYLGYTDWRMPDAKELQSIVDYSHAPTADQSPAINPLFKCTAIVSENGSTDYPFYWTSTTHINNHKMGNQAVYISFGTAFGWMKFPQSNHTELIDVHGAGAQRSDPKNGNPKDYPYGRGPQGDVIRIFNFVRLVRNIE